MFVLTVAVLDFADKNVEEFVHTKFSEKRACEGFHSMFSSTVDTTCMILSVPSYVDSYSCIPPAYGSLPATEPIFMT